MSSRRQFITLLGGAAVTWPVVARAQQSERVRRIGVLMGLSEDNPEAQRWIMALRGGLEALGWNDGRNVTIDVRWGGGDAEHLRAYPFVTRTAGRVHFGRVQSSPWQRRTNVWRKETSPARGSKRLRGVRPQGRGREKNNPQNHWNGRLFF
jgi:hypothetical protein